MLIYNFSDISCFGLIVFL